MNTRVVHCKKEKYDVYIGRPSKWGNPFEIGVHGNREEVIQKYRAWIMTQPQLLNDLHELKGKTIACWCHPHACHGDVLAQLVNTAFPTHTFCFTGHRPGSLGGYQDNPIQRDVKLFLHSQIVRLIQQYSDVQFITGAALGVDTWAGDQLLLAKEQLRFVPDHQFDVKWTLAIPYQQHYEKWPKESQQHFWVHKQAADEVVYVHDTYQGNWMLQKRNEWMVDRSKGVIAIWDGEHKGGTFNCIKYALNRGVPVIAYNPHTRQISYPKYL